MSERSTPDNDVASASAYDCHRDRLQHRDQLRRHRSRNYWARQIGRRIPTPKRQRQSRRPLNRYPRRQMCFLHGRTPKQCSGLGNTDISWRTPLRSPQRTRYPASTAFLTPSTTLCGLWVGDDPCASRWLSNGRIDDVELWEQILMQNGEYAGPNGQCATHPEVWENSLFRKAVGAGNGKRGIQ
jgi:hypothetical protein